MERLQNSNPNVISCKPNLYTENINLIKLNNLAMSSNTNNNKNQDNKKQLKTKKLTLEEMLEQSYLLFAKIPGSRKLMIKNICKIIINSLK